jgi:hypothetical protein
MIFLSCCDGMLFVVNRCVFKLNFDAISWVAVIVVHSCLRRMWRDQCYIEVIQNDVLRMEESVRASGFSRPFISFVWTLYSQFTIRKKGLSSFSPIRVGLRM